MSVKKFKPAQPRMLEDEDALRIERSKQLIKDTKRIVRETQLLIMKSQRLREAVKKTRNS